MTNTAADLFPLPLEPFEWYMLEDDAGPFPMTSTVTVEVAGTLDREAFVESVSDALQRHPLLTSVVERRGWKPPVWVPSSIPADVTFVDAYRTQFPDVVGAAGGSADEATAADENFVTEWTPPLADLDVTQRPGLRVTVYQEGEKAAVCFDVHHATADGIGTHCFIGDVFALYGQRKSFGAPPELKPLDSGLLPNRGRLSPEIRSAMRTRRYWSNLVGGTFRYLALPPVPVAPDSGQTQRDVERTITARSRSLAKAQLRRLRRVLHSRQQTLNDLLLTELFRSLRDWNAARGGSDGERLRLVVPTNLRGQDMAQLPAANGIFYMFLAFRRREIRNDPSFAETVTTQMRKRVELHSGSVYAVFSKAASRVPGLLPLFVSRSTGSGTAVGSFIGDPSRTHAAKFPRQKGRLVAGDVVLERYSVRGTIRPGTFLNLSASVYADRLSLNVTADERHCGQGAAGHFAEDLQNRIARHAEDASVQEEP